MPTSTMPPHRMLENENQTSDVGGNGEAVVRHVLLLFICHLIFSHCSTHLNSIIVVKTCHENPSLSTTVLAKNSVHQTIT